MNRRTGILLVWAAAWTLALMHAAGAASGQAPRQSGTLVIAGQPDQAPLVRINGKSYVDIESLARLTHGSLRFEGPRTILTLPAAGTASAAPEPAAAGNPPPGLTQAFLNAEIVALAQIREWHVALVNAVNNSVPVTENLVGPIKRQADAKLQLALAAATSGPDQRAAELLRNEFSNMQQMSDQFVQMHDNAAYVSPDVFNNNALDAKIQGCQSALAQMAASKQFQDDPQCH